MLKFPPSENPKKNIVSQEFLPLQYSRNFDAPDTENAMCLITTFVSHVIRFYRRTSRLLHCRRCDLLEQCSAGPESTNHARTPGCGRTTEWACGRSGLSSFQDSPTVPIWKAGACNMLINPDSCECAKDFAVSQENICIR